MEFNPANWRRFQGSVKLRHLIVETDDNLREGESHMSRDAHNNRLVHFNEELNKLVEPSERHRENFRSLTSAEAFAVQYQSHLSMKNQLFSNPEFLAAAFDSHYDNKKGLRVIAHTGFEVGSELTPHVIDIGSNTSKRTYHLPDADIYEDLARFRLTSKFINGVCGEGALMLEGARFEEGVCGVSRAHPSVNSYFSLKASNDVIRASRLCINSESIFLAYGSKTFDAIPVIECK